MAKKISGADFKAFHSDDDFWPEGAWCDGDLFSVNGKEVDDLDALSLKDDDQVQILSGYVLTEGGEEIATLPAFYARWSRSRTHCRVVVEVPRSSRDEFEKLVAKMGGKVA